jgi:hypothetical protein
VPDIQYLQDAGAFVGERKNLPDCLSLRDRTNITAGFIKMDGWALWLPGQIRERCQHQNENGRTESHNDSIMIKVPQNTIAN